MADQVVSRLLLGAVEAVKGDAQGAGAHHLIGAAGQTLPIQSPVQRAGMQARLRAQRARGRQTGADTQDRILGEDLCYLWVVEKHKHTTQKVKLLFTDMLRSPELVKTFGDS